MTTPEMIRFWGYPAEVISVTTEDGYILEIHRIPWGKTNESQIPGKKKPIVFLQHGLEGASDNWVENLPSQSAGFMFADAGFDVWLGNVRGNTYSKAHKSLDPKKKEFWEFSWDQMVQYDLDAMINHVLNVTAEESLYYIGHSQGTLIMFSKFGSDQNFAKKIKRYFALAPVGTVKYIKVFLKLSINAFVKKCPKNIMPKKKFFQIIYDILGDGEFLPQSWVTKLISDFVCSGIVGNDLCDDIMFLLGGPESNQLNRTRTPVYTAHAPAGTSTQNILHWAQMVLSGKVEKYDYRSAKKNQQHYGSSKPPEYDFTLINAPVHLYWSDADWLGDKKDIQEFLLPNLPPQYLAENNHIPDFEHFDFIWGLNAAKMIYQPIIKTIKNDFVKD
uniref:Lipase n=1 Tax=Panagrolaimus superbus TaxID=310955 RepID=A0A914YMQ5_9BILA